MARLADPHLLACYRRVLENRRFTGYVTLEGQAPARLRQHFAGWTREAFLDLLADHVEAGGEIDQVEEEREPWRDFWEFHYDLRPDVDGIKHFVETRMKPEWPKDPEDATIIVVNIHPA
ncbi:MAG: hypothetical protein K2W96_26830 [Gemmataceae bacterium]|nr:hypothetical protein [Gemmataceae bacterium]